jgi:hypothetical protein
MQAPPGPFQASPNGVTPIPTILAMRDVPSAPYSNDQWAWDSFRRDASEYIDCINEYIDAGDQDIRRIREAQQDALSEAQMFTNRIRR